MHCDAQPTGTPHQKAMEIAAINRRIDRPIVLVGMMGAGKTTVGRKLAAMLGRRFDDADEAIVAAAQMEVGEIFERFGETYFREGERRVIARLIAGHNGVIATGGGAFVNPATRMMILDLAIAVWIDCPLDVLVERTSRRDTRPLLRGGDPRAILADLFEKRRPFYEQAPIRVSSAAGPHTSTAEAIIEALDQWL